MKKIVLGLLAFTAFVGCAKNEISQNRVTNNEYSLRASLPHVTKATVNTNDWKVRWSEGDCVSILAEGHDAEYLELTGGAGTADGCFGGNPLFSPEYALYPMANNHDLSGTSILFELPSDYAYSEFVGKNTNVPMIAKVESNALAEGTAKFKHVGGLMSVSYRNMPAGTNKFVLTSETGYISGKFTTEYSDGRFTSLSTSAVSEGGKTITISFDAVEEGADMFFYLPLPTMSEETIRIALYKGSDKVARSGKKLSNVTISAGEYFVMPAIIVGREGADSETGTFDVTYTYNFNSNTDNTITIGSKTTTDWVWSLTNYTDQSTYYQCPTGTDANTSVASFPNVFKGKTVTSDVVVTLDIATYGSGTNPSGSTFEVYKDNACSSKITSSQGGTLPSSNSYTSATYTVTQTNAQQFGDDLYLKITKPGKTIRLRSVRIAFGYSQGTPEIATLVSLATPIDLTASNVTENSAEISWSAIAGASSYKVEYKKATVNDWSVLSPNPATNNTTLSSLASETEYEVRITALAENSLENSDMSDILAFNTKQSEGGPSLSYTINFANNASGATAISSSVNATTAIDGSDNGIHGTNYVTAKPFTVSNETGYTNCYYGDTKTCIRLATSGNNASLTIALSTAGQVNAKSIIVTCYSTGKKNSDATLSVNGSTAQSTPQDDYDDLTFNFSGNTTITNINLESVKSVYIDKIVVNY